MKNIYLWGIIITAVMVGLTYFSVLGSKGGLNGDIVNILTVAAAVVLVLVTVFVIIKYVRQMQVDKAEGQLADENWDDIGEYLNPIPKGLAIFFILILGWGFWYFLFGYPPQSYTKIGEYNEDVAAYNAKFEKKYASMTQEELVEMGESVFLSECKICHGLTADGIDGTASNLTVRLEEKVVKHAVVNGSNHKLMGFENPMPDRNGLFNANTETVLTDAEIDAVSKYVANGMSGDGAEVYAGTCASCHGVDGTGMENVAPNIAAFDTALVVNVLNYGKKGVIGAMPIFDRLNDKQKEAAGAYVASISK